jgi:nucleotide-binding universal stress UspA family protein
MKFATVLAAIDVHDDLAEAVLKAAASLAEKDSASLHVVSVWPSLAEAVPYTAPAPGFPMEATAPAVSQAAIEEHAKERARHTDEVAALVRRIAPQASIDVADGDPGDVVPEIARIVKADVIVTGSHQKGFWGALAHRATSRELIRSAPCAVFVVTKACAEKALSNAH